MLNRCVECFVFRDTIVLSIKAYFCRIADPFQKDLHLSESLEKHNFNDIITAVNILNNNILLIFS